jgi:hypothetical protein
MYVGVGLGPYMKVVVLEEQANPLIHVIAACGSYCVAIIGLGRTVHGQAGVKVPYIAPDYD